MKISKDDLRLRYYFAIHSLVTAAASLTALVDSTQTKIPTLLDQILIVATIFGFICIPAFLIVGVQFLFHTNEHRRFFVMLGCCDLLLSGLQFVAAKILIS